MAGIKHVTINRYNYILELPKDFKDILAVYRSGVICIDSFDTFSKRFGAYRDQPAEEFFIVRLHPDGKTDLKLRGQYSKYWLVRKFQQLADLYWPVKYKITYYSK